MTGTSKVLMSLCVLLLAALVVYYGMTPPQATVAQGIVEDTPKKQVESRPSLFSRDPFGALEKIGIPPAAAKITTDVPVATIEGTVEREVVSQQSQKSQKTQKTLPVSISSSHKLYQVKAGETLGEIASRELGSTRLWREIATLNSIDDPSRIMPGSILRMPHVTTAKQAAVPAAVPAGVRDAMTHRVVEGDTLSSIAGDYYGDVNKYDVIASANPNVDPSRLAIGMVLIIPKR